MKRVIILNLMFLSICFLSNAQESKTLPLDSLINFSFDCKGLMSEIAIPDGNLEPKYYSYGEGYIIAIPYPDSSNISIVCGPNADLKINNDDPSLHSRVEKTDLFSISYENVKEARLKTFDRAFDKLKNR